MVALKADAHFTNIDHPDAVEPLANHPERAMNASRFGLTIEPQKPLTMERASLQTQFSRRDRAALSRLACRLN